MTAFENGDSNLFLEIQGTVPVAFRGTQYNFPIACWVLYGYPREAPLVFVRPAQDMMIRPSQHVGTDGRIYHPYLSQWAKYWDVSSVLSTQHKPLILIEIIHQRLCVRATRGFCQRSSCHGQTANADSSISSYASAGSSSSSGISKIIT